MILRTALSVLALGLVAPAASALTLAFPGPGRMTADEAVAMGQARLPVAAFDGRSVAVRTIEGPVIRQAWQLPSQRLTTLQILKPLREQLLKDGYDIRFECRDRVCGGFDFRFSAGALAEPAMHVDLGDFRYLMAENAQGEAVALLVSRSANSGFVQLTRVGIPGAKLADKVVTSSKSMPPVMPESTMQALPTPLAGPLLDSLATDGRAPLDDLLFQTGSANLEATEFPSLRSLAAFLATNPGQSVTLVGHTDAEGALDGNIALSRRRAAAVRESLVRDYGVSRSQLHAEGVGFLAPRASNATADGRLANRRVEVVLTE